jgi:hypothetical protein
VGTGVAYQVQISDYWQEYLDGLPISSRAKQKISDFIDYALAHVNDEFRIDPANRPWPGKPFFRRDFVFLDRDPSGAVSGHRLLCYLRDDMAPFGVLLLVFVDHEKYDL